MRLAVPYMKTMQQDVELLVSTAKQQCAHRFVLLEFLFAHLRTELVYGLAREVAFKPIDESPKPV